MKYIRLMKILQSQDFFYRAAFYKVILIVNTLMISHFLRF